MRRENNTGHSRAIINGGVLPLKIHSNFNEMLGLSSDDPDELRK